MSKSPREVTVTVSAEMYAELDKRAAPRGQSVAKYLTVFLEEYGRDEWLEVPDDSLYGFLSHRNLRRWAPGTERPVPVRRHVRRRA